MRVLPFISMIRVTSIFNFLDIPLITFPYQNLFLKIYTLIFLTQRDNCTENVLSKCQHLLGCLFSKNFTDVSELSCWFMSRAVFVMLNSSIDTVCIRSAQKVSLFVWVLFSLILSRMFADPLFYFLSL